MSHVIIGVLIVVAIAWFVLAGAGRLDRYENDLDFRDDNGREE